MKSKLLVLRVQAFLVDEDDAGDVIATVPLDPVEVTRPQLAEHLRAIDELCRTRTLELEQAKPNRAARRAARKPTRRKP